MTYLVVTLLYAFMPGPAMLYSVAQTISGGKRTGVLAVLGLHIGGYVHVVLAVSGLSALLVAQPEMYAFVQRLGAVYLIFIGIQRIVQSAQFSFENTPYKTGQPPTKIFIDSVIVDVLNPKAALFYFAFLPQFIDDEVNMAAGVQMLLLGVATNIIFSSADLISVFLSDHLRKKLDQNNQYFHFCLRWSGSIFIVLGVLALSR